MIDVRKGLIEGMLEQSVVNQKRLTSLRMQRDACVIMAKTGVLFAPAKHIQESYKHCTAIDTEDMLTDLRSWTDVDIPSWVYFKYFKSIDLTHLLMKSHELLPIKEYLTLVNKYDMDSCALIFPVSRYGLWVAHNFTVVGTPGAARIVIPAAKQGYSHISITTLELFCKEWYNTFRKGNS